MWTHYLKGSREGSWTTTEFATRDEAVAWAKAKGPGTVVSEDAAHSTDEWERVTIGPLGEVLSSRHVTCG